MPTDPQPEQVRNRLTEIREKRGIAAAELARRVGVSRQTIYAIEAGAYVPNTAVALRLAQTLEVTVEELFLLEAAGSGELETRTVELLEGLESAPGVGVQLCRVGEELVGVPAIPAVWQLTAADAVMMEPHGRKQRVRLVREVAENRLLMAGCDPAMSVVARHAREAETELVLAASNSSRALELLKSGRIHIAGTHLGEGSAGRANLTAIGKLFPRGGVAVITFGTWEEGLVVRAGNPREIRSVADLARRGVTVVNREAGAGSRALLDAELKKAGVEARRIRGYDVLAAGHLAAAWRVHAGLADCCVATRAAARAFGLDFIPLREERYDLAIRKEHLELPGVIWILDVLSRSAFRRELETLGGYDTRETGVRVL